MAVQNLPRYAFDPHARVPANLVTNERHTLTPKNGYTYHYIVPDYAPFFVIDLKVYKLTQLGAKQYLVEGVDYKLGFEFLQAVNSTGIPVYGAISFINRTLTGDVYIEYRTVGGDWTISANKIAEIIAELQYNPVYTTWEQVANIPYQFPPTEHSHDVKDMTSFQDLLTVLRALGERLNGGAGTVNQQQVTEIVERILGTTGKATLGLDKLRNLEILPLNDGNNNTDNYYVTPRGVRDIINSVAMPIINQHINSRGNVHGLTAEDIGAVTSADIDARLATKLGKNEKAADTVLFDGRNSQQLKTFVLEGTSANTAKFNGLTYTEMVDDVKNKLNAILASQGGDTTANLAARMLQLTSGDSNKFGNRTPEQYATWLLANNQINAATLSGFTKESIISEARSNVNANLLNSKTSEQIIAEAKQNVNAAQLGGKTAAQLLIEAKQNVDAALLGGLNKDQLLAQAREANTLGGKTLQQVITDAQINVNAARLSGQTAEQIIAKARENISATNATRLEGKTVRELTSEISTSILNSLDDTKVHMGTGVGQAAVTTRGSNKINVVKIGKANDNTALPMVTIDQTNMGHFFLYRKALGAESINDLKTVASIGIYSQANDSAATTNLGYPDRKAGTLMVLPSAYSVQQCYFTWNDGSIYFRHAEQNGNWSQWIKTGIDSSKISHLTNGTDQSKIASEKAVGDLNRALTQAVNELKAFFIDSSTNRIKENLLPAPKWQ